MHFSVKSKKVKIQIMEGEFDKKDCKLSFNFKDDISRFTNVHFKAMSDKVLILNKISMFTILKTGYFQLWFFVTFIMRISTAGN